MQKEFLWWKFISRTPSYSRKLKAIMGWWLILSACTPSLAPPSWTQTLINPLSILIFTACKVSSQPFPRTQDQDSWQLHASGTHKIMSLKITMNTLTSTLQALVTEVKWFVIVLALNWLRQNITHVNWATSTLIISREDLNHKFYPESVGQSMKDNVFSVSKKLRMSESFLRLTSTPEFLSG